MSWVMSGSTPYVFILPRDPVFAWLHQNAVEVGEPSWEDVKDLGSRSNDWYICAIDDDERVPEYGVVIDNSESYRRCARGVSFFNRTVRSRKWYVCSGSVLDECRLTDRPPKNHWERGRAVRALYGLSGPAIDFGGGI